MAANDEFPRGWTLSVVVSGAGTATITVPSLAGVAHVLDSFEAKVSNTSTTQGAGDQITVSSSLATYSGFVIGLLGASLVAAAGDVNTDEASGSGLGLATAPGESLTVAFNGPAFAGATMLLVIQGHDV